MSHVLKLADNLSLPLDAVTNKLAFLGMNGSGKTYAAMKAAELMLGAKAQVVCLDPVGVWYGLRLAANGKSSSGIDIPVFGGLYGDLPLEHTAGALLADVIVDRGISVVLDISQFEYDTHRTKFCTEFALRLFQRKKKRPSALHIFIDEAQEILPQNPARGEEGMLHEWIRIGKMGRNFGLGWSLISPRPQEVNKKALNLSGAVLAFRTNGTHERKAIAEWVKDKAQDVDIVQALPKLKVGEAHVWSPGWLEISENVQILPKQTFNASATPKVGAAAVEARPLEKIDLKALEKAMAATIEKSKAEDPKELKRRIAELTKQLAGKVQPMAADPAAVQRKVDSAVTVREKQLRAEFDGRIRDVRAAASLLTTSVTRARVSLDAIGEMTGKLNRALAVPVVFKHFERVFPDVESRSETMTSPTSDSVFVSSEPTNGTIPGAQRKILNAIATLNALGVDQPTIVQVALLNGVSHTTGSYLQNLRELETAGYIARGLGKVQLVPGAKFTPDVDIDRDPLDFWYDKLDGAKAKLLRAIVGKYPAPISKTDLAAAVSVSPTTGSFQQNIRDLRTYGIVTVDNGNVTASELLFPAGVR